MLRTLVFFAVFIPGLFAAFRSRHAALLLYLWYAFFRPEDWVYFGLTNLHLSLLIGVLAVVPAFFAGVFPDVKHPLSVAALTFFLAALIAEFGAYNPLLGLTWLAYLFKLLVITLLIPSVVLERRQLLLTIAVVALSFGFHAAKAGLASLLAGGLRFGVGPGGAYVDNNGYGIAMAMTIPLLVCIAQNTISRPLKALAMTMVPLIGFAIVATYSRSAFLSGVAVALVLTLMQRRRVLWLVLLILGLIPFGVFISRQDGYMARMQTIETYQQVDETSALSRLHFWRVALVMFEHHPLGVGLFNFESAYDDYDFLHGEYGEQRSVHSSHFQALAETGMIGAIAWAWLFIASGILLVRIRRRALRIRDPVERRTYRTIANALIASMVAFLVGGSFIALALNDLTWLTFGLVAALDRISHRAEVAEATEAVAAPIAWSPAYGAWRPPLAARP